MKRNICTDSAKSSSAYAAIKRDCQRLGLDANAIRRNLVQDARVLQGQCFVKTRAFKPTGVALGCPLPHLRLESMLHALAIEAEVCLRELTGKSRVFAHVPQQYYHVTIVNRDHFDLHSSARPVRRMGAAVFRRTKEIIRRLHLGAVELEFKGWQLTRSGRLLVQGYPHDDNKIFRLRSALLEAAPELRANPPVTAHMKIGHVLVHLREPDLHAFLGWMRVQSGMIQQQARFDSAYTQNGRIQF